MTCTTLEIRHHLTFGDAMSPTPTGPGVAAPLSRALAALDQALDAPRRAGVPRGNWRWLVRQRLGALREALSQQSGTTDQGWLAARGGPAFVERNALLARLGTLSDDVLATPDVEATRLVLKRVVGDVAHHLQAQRGTTG